MLWRKTGSLVDQTMRPWRKIRTRPELGLLVCLACAQVPETDRPFPRFELVEVNELAKKWWYRQDPAQKLREARFQRDGQFMHLRAVDSGEIHESVEIAAFVDVVHFYNLPPGQSPNCTPLDGASRPPEDRQFLAAAWCERGFCDRSFLLVDNDLFGFRVEPVLACAEP
jgi:hypothetical protein